MEYSFTYRYEGVVSTLFTPVKVNIARTKEQIENEEQQVKQNFEAMAIWDTGATNSVITDSIINPLNLKQIATTSV